MEESIHSYGWMDGRIPRLTINLLYLGAQVDLNRGNHYDQLIPKEEFPLNTMRVPQITHSLNPWITVGRAQDKEVWTGFESQPILTTIVPPSTGLEKAHSPPRKVLFPLSKRDKRLPWNATSGKPPEKEGEGKIVRDRNSLPFGIITKPPPESTSSKYRKKRPPKAHHRKAKLPNSVNQKGVLVQPVRAKRGIDKNVSAGQWTRGMDCCLQTWSHRVHVMWETQQQNLT